MTFKPILDILRHEQGKLWPALSAIPDSFVLYGGTALALRLGHRSSVGFDFRSSEAIDIDGLFRIPFLARAEVLQREADTLTVSVMPAGTINPVKVSFSGGIDTGRVGDPEPTDDGVLRVASLLDLFGTKLKRITATRRRQRLHRPGGHLASRGASEGRTGRRHDSPRPTVPACRGRKGPGILRRGTGGRR